MVQLKQVSLRLKSIKNIQKITKTMKMVSASKFTKAEKELSAARPFGYGPRKFYESTRLVSVSKPGEKEALKPNLDTGEEKEDKKMKRIFVAVTSDRGLCGGVHSGVARRIRRDMAALGADPAVNKCVCIGDKSRGMLRRTYPLCMLVSVKDVGRLVPVFGDAVDIAAAIAESGFLYDFGEIYYNKYFSPVKYELSVIPFFNKERIETAPNINAFDEVEHDQLESYVEFTMAALIYFALKENLVSELSSRMTAMDNATKNAEDMIRDLTLLYNRTRQAVITRELVEIISGAAALRN